MWKLIYILFFILYTLAVPAQEKRNVASPELSSQNYILILSSYQYDNPYTTAITKKLQYYLEQENPGLIFRTVYASLDIQQTMLASRLNMQKAFGQARLTPGVLLPRILVLVGDESWMLYRIMNLRGKWGKVPVVLCGVNPKIHKDYTNFFFLASFADSLMISIPESAKQLQVTGVLKDNVSYNASIFMHKMMPSLKEIVYISGGNYSDEYAWQEEQKNLSALYPELKLSYFNRRLISAEEICHYTDQLSCDSAAILFHSYPGFLSSLKLPAFSLRDGGPGNNEIVGGYFTSSDQYARQTASLVMRIYNGSPVSELPFQYVQNHHFYLNAQAPYLPQSNWEPKELPGLIYYNVPQPFVIRHLRLIAMILLIAVIGATSFLIFRKTRRYQSHIQTLLKKYKVLHEKFQTIYDNMPVALLIFNEQGKLMKMNPTAKRLQKNWNIKNPETLKLFQDIVTDKRLQEKIHQQENINRILPIQQGKFQPRPSELYEDSCEYFRLVIRYIPDEIHNAGNILVMLIDNTEIYSEKINHKRMRSIFNFAMNKAAIGVAEYNLYSKTGVATDWWRKNMNLQEKTKPESYSIYRYLAPEDQKTIRQFFKDAYEGKREEFSGEIRVLHKDGSVHYLREQIKVMEFRPENGQVWLAELNQNIDKEKKYATEIQASIAKAQEAERLKNTFIANMSHEIRSPLNAIVGFSNLMLNTQDITLRSEMIHHIEESNETLLRLVNDIIDLSKIESGTMTFAFSVIDMNALLRDLDAMFQLKANQKHLQLECICPQEELYIHSDKIRLRQVISNFISNAIKFTTIGSICVGYQLENKKLYVYVRDTGIGIPGDQVSKIFNRFYRADKTYQGYGLGLSIAQAVIEGLKGEIGVESEQGKGSTFWFRIPVEIIKNNSPANKLANEMYFSELPANQHPRLLIVEDNESNFLLMHFMLRECFYITHAWNGEEAVELYRKGQYDLILMDIKMPKKNGYQATQEIRALSSQVPIIATTAYAFSKDETLALNNGFNAFLAKPLKKQTLLDTIYYWLNHAN